MYEEARLVARYVLTPSSLKEDREDHDQLHSTDCEPQCVDPATGTSTGTPVEWSTTFLEKVAPAIRRGYSYITETCKHEIDMIGFAKILVDDFSEENFFTITNMIATEDISQLNWGRIIAFFTFLSFVAADLAKKERHADIETLEQWLVKFLSRKDILGWIADRGGWVSQLRVQSTTHTLGWSVGVSLLSFSGQHWFHPQQRSGDGELVAVYAAAI